MNKQKVLPRIVIQSIGGGLLLMALFTMMWAGIAQGGLIGHDHHVVLITFGFLSILFVSFSIRLFIGAKSFPTFTNEEDRKRGKQMSKSFGIIFGVEGTAIPIACALLGIFGKPQFILPAIALIVGIHFYPMAKVFKRKIDYYLATFTCVWALVSVYLIYTGYLPQAIVLTILGIGVALVTSTYGVYMMMMGYKLTEERNRQILE